jgi:excisionase family DNA binding protein
MTDMNVQNSDSRRQPEDGAARPRATRPNVHPKIEQYVTVVNALVDEHLTDDAVATRLERVLRDTKSSTPADGQTSCALSQGAPQRAGEKVPQSAERRLTANQVAALFRVDPKTVTRWASAGRIDSVRTPGGHRRFRETEVRALLTSLTTSTSPARVDTQLHGSDLLLKWLAER